MKNKIVKTFESFVANKNFKFEEVIIDPILEYIRDNQEELTKEENLPILAKLGYMYNTLWYAGRLGWGYDSELRGGKLKETDEDGEEYNYSDCEENPKYKIEMCNPQNDRIEKLIYQAWGMHVTNGFGPTYDEFYKIIYEGEEMTELRKLSLKKHKTLEDWVEINMHKDYKYRSKTRKEVLNHMLCVIGNGYDLNKDGFISSSSGTGLDSSDYGDWKNAKFTGELKTLVDKIMSMPELKVTLDHQEKKSKEYKENSIDKRTDDLLMKIAKSMNIDVDNLSKDEIMELIMGGGKKPEKPKVEPYVKYYPISKMSEICRMVDREFLTRMGIEKVDPSYINGAIEVCNDILTHESEEDPNNVKYANTILKKIKGTYVDFDKYGLLNDIKNAFLTLTDNFGYKEDLRAGDIGNYYNLYLNDTAKNEYADNNYFIRINCVNSDMPLGMSNDIDYLKDTSIYNDLLESIEKVGLLKDIKELLFYYTHTPNVSEISISLYKNGHEYKTEVKANEEQFKKLGFVIGKSYLKLDLPEVGLSLETIKPEPLGSTHPNNKDGHGYFSKAKDFTVIDGNFTLKFNIDERGFNIIRGNVPRDARHKAIYNWVLKIHKDVKDGDSGYGTYNSNDRTGRDGEKKLYAHILMLALRDNQDKLKI